MKNYSAILKQIDLFNSLSDSQLEQINALCKELQFPKEQLIFSENSRDTELYIVLDGEVGILVNPSLVSSKPMSNVGSESIAVLRKGQVFGELALADEGIRSASVKSLQDDTHVLQIARKPLLDLCKQDTDLGFKIMYNLCNELAMKVRTADLQLRDTFLDT